MHPTPSYHLRVCSCAVLLAMLSRGHTEDTPIVLNSRVDAVTVHLDRAMITRTASVLLAPGRHQVVFGQLPIDLEDGFLRSQVDNGLTIEGLHARIRRPPESALAGDAAFTQQIADLTWEIAGLDQELHDNQQAQTLLQSIQRALLKRAEHTPGADAPPPPSLEELSRLLAFQQEEQGRLSTAQRLLRHRKSALEAQRQDLQQESARLRQATPTPFKEAVLVLVNDTDAPVAATIRLHYLLPGALWYPTYDLHDGDDDVEMTVAAVIQNATGEDWQQARIILSTARHDSDLMEDELRPWRLLDEAVKSVQAERQLQHSTYFNSALATDSPVDSLREQLSNRQSARDRRAHQHLLDNATHIARLSASLRERAATVAIPVPGREHIPATGEAQRVLLGRFRMTSNRSFRARPEAGARVSAWGTSTWEGPWPLLPGDMQVHRQAVMVGHARLPFIAPGEAMTVPLGLEERIVITHRRDPAASQRSTFSGSHRLHAHYEVEVRNLLDQAITLSLQVRLPVSNSSDLRLHHPPAQPAFTSIDQGVAIWQLELAGQERRILSYGYQAEWPISLHIPELHLADR